MTGNFRNSNYTEPEENTSHALVPRRWYRELGPARSFTYPAETGEPEGGRRPRTRRRAGDTARVYEKPRLKSPVERERTVLPAAVRVIRKRTREAREKRKNDNGDEAPGR